jgi:hypothetical protein
MTIFGARWVGPGRSLIVMALLGAALLYGDGIITPAISVLSAVEGLNVATSFSNRTAQKDPVARHSKPPARLANLALIAATEVAQLAVLNFAGGLRCEITAHT